MQFTGEGFGFGPIFFHYYGIVIMLGTLAGGFLAAREAKKRGLDPEIVWDMLIWLIIFAVAGARIWHILTPDPALVASGVTTYYYLTHPLDAIAIWKGGLGIVGGVVGGAIGLYIFCRRNKLSFLMWADIIAPALALGQAIGRWGNYFNQELYGAPTDLPWKLYISPEHRYPEFANVSYYHPTFLYESILNLLNVFLILWIGRRYSKVLKTGDLFFVYLISYPIIRFFMEMLRLNSSTLGGINANQALVAVVALLSAAFLVWRHRKPRAKPGLPAISETPAE